ncbi:MAG TPA: type II secretion system protein GspG [Kiritimatiellae bacterium]|nr:type II secretion system protein GspG [Kiritimatiellia bacterium]
METRDDRCRRAVRRNGFTLIEILLVVVIIGILVGVALPRLGGRKRQAEIAAARADIANISTALSLYELDNGSYPPSLQALVSNPGGAQNWNGPYLQKGVPKDPWGNDYVYTYPGVQNPHGFDLKSLGPDGVESDDDITNWQP